MSSKTKLQVETNHKPPLVQVGEGFNLPLEELMEFRAIAAETALIQMQVVNALAPLQARREEILNGWKERYEIENMASYEVDLKNMALVPKKSPVIAMPKSNEG